MIKNHCWNWPEWWMNGSYLLLDLLGAMVWHRALALSGLICDSSVQRMCHLHSWDGAQGTLHIKMGCLPTALTPRPKPAAKSAPVQSMDNLPAVLCSYRKGFRKGTFSHYLQKTWEGAGLCVQHVWISQFQLSKGWWVLPGAVWRVTAVIFPGQNQESHWTGGIRTPPRIRGIVKIKQNVILLKLLP